MRRLYIFTPHGFTERKPTHSSGQTGGCQIVDNEFRFGFNWGLNDHCEAH